MRIFKYIGPRTLRPGEVEIEIPGRAFKAGAGDVSARKRRKNEALEPGEMRRATVVKDSTLVKIPRSDRFVADWFKRAMSVEGLPLFKEIP